MLKNVFNEINKDLEREKSRQDFYDFLHEDVEFNNFIDENLLRLSENGVNNVMLKNEMPFLFIEDTVVDDELVTNLQNEVEYEDSFNRKPIIDLDTTTKFQEPVDYNDNFNASYTSDVEADTDLNREVDYSDNQKSPVNIDEFSNEATELLFEMGDIEAFLEAECDMTVPNEVKCPDCGDTIDQADEADVDDTEYPNRPEGVVMEDDNELEESFFGLFEADEEEFEVDSDDASSDEMPSDSDDKNESFFGLFESSDEDDEDEEDDDSDEEDSDDEDDEDEEDDDSDEDDEEDSDDEDDEDESKSESKKCKSESFSILDLFE